MPLPRLLVVGVGSIGERHVRCFQRTGRASVAIAEVNESLRSSIAERYGLAEAFGSVEEALHAPFDAAVICTPANLHIPIASQLARRGIHLLIEKPLSTNLEGIDPLQQLVRDKQLIAAVAYVLRCHPVYAGLRETLRSGRFGRPVQLVGQSGQHFPTYRPAYRNIYYADRARGGGAIQDALTHLINACEWLVGPITAVAADAAHQLLEGVTVEDTAHVLARHGEVLAAYSLNQYQAPNESTLTIVCTGGTLRAEVHELRYRWMTEPGGSWQDQPVGTLERDDLFVAQANRFLDSLAGAPVACTLSEALQTLRVNLAILEASDTHQWRTIP